MDYTELKEIRNAIIEELKQEMAPAPFTIELYRIAELRVQTVLMLRQLEAMTAPKLDDDTPDMAPTHEMLADIKESTQETKDLKEQKP